MKVKIYNYTWYRFLMGAEFAMFCSTNKEDIFSAIKTPEEEKAKELIESFIKDWKNTKGGCGCNIAKRRDHFKRTYLDLVMHLDSGGCEAIINQMKSLLNSVEKIHIYKDNTRYTEDPYLII